MRLKYRRYSLVSLVSNFIEENKCLEIVQTNLTEPTCHGTIYDRAARRILRKVQQMNIINLRDKHKVKFKSSWMDSSVYQLADKRHGR